MSGGREATVAIASVLGFILWLSLPILPWLTLLGVKIMTDLETEKSTVGDCSCSCIGCDASVKECIWDVQIERWCHE